MKKFLLTIILLFTVSSVYAGEHYYVRTVYANSAIALDLLCSAAFDKNANKIRYLHDSGMVKVIDDGERVEVRDVKIIPKEEAFVELPTDMIEFKLMDDYRTYYTLDNLLTRVFK